MIWSAVALVAAGFPAQAATLPATPDGLPAVLAVAKGGDVVQLAPGARYVAPRGFSGRTWSPPLKIDARGAELERWTLANVDGLEISGGVLRNGCGALACYNYALRFDGGRNIRVAGAAFIGPEAATAGTPYQRADGYGVGFIGTTDFQLVGNTFVSFKTGAVLNKVSRFAVTGNRFNRMRSDGLAIGQGWSGLIEANVCDGTRILSEEHPDCIQGWSRPDAPPTSDLVIRRNRGVGEMQVIFLGNHRRLNALGQLVDDGGFDRILIEDNDATGAYPNGVALYDGRRSTVRNNRVRTLPGAPYIVRVVTTGDVVRCGNVAEAGAGKQAQVDPAC